MHRIASADSGVAAQVVDLLTGVVQTPEGEAACWLTEHASLQLLLDLALAPESDANPLAERVLRWCDRQTPQAAWLRSSHGAAVDLCVANPSPQLAIAEVAWSRAHDVPLGIPAISGGLTTESIPPPLIDEPAHLVIELGTNSLVLPVDRTPRAVEPPGLTIGPLLPHRSLADARGGTFPAPPPLEWQTFAHVRRLMGRWEIMLECRWPTGTLARPPWDGEAVDVVWTCDGLEHQTRVTPTGIASTSNDAVQPRAHVSQQTHAWLCRLVLPESWTSCGTPALSLRRSHARSDASESWPTPETPWFHGHDGAAIDIEAWDGRSPDVR